MIADRRKDYLLTLLPLGSAVNVGAGALRVPGAISVDANPKVHPDVVADFHHLPFDDTQFTTAVAFDVIEHTREPEGLLRELERVAKNQLVVCLDFDLAPKNWSDDPTHVYYINEEAFRRILEPRGYKTLRLGAMLAGLRGAHVKRHSFMRYGKHYVEFVCSRLLAHVG